MQLGGVGSAMGMAGIWTVAEHEGRAFYPFLGAATDCLRFMHLQAKIPQVRVFIGLILMHLKLALR